MGFNSSLGDVYTATNETHERSQFLETEYRSKVLDDVFEIKAFLHQRLTELTNGDTSSLQHQVQAVAPFVLQQYTSDAIHTMISDISLAISNADSDHPVLKEEQDAQIGQGTRGDVTILPTLIVNNRQYQGKLEKGVVLKAICSGFEETTEPAVCLSGDVETNECLNDNGGCWQDKAANISACKDTFRGRVCECPFTDDVLYKGDGYTPCIASGPGRCKVNNGGCWHETRDGHTFSACPSYMDSEIRAIMAQYMPLDSQGEVPNHQSEDQA
ncbi:hypothetical protein AgCh_014955 [Apium graveolens]